MSEKVESDDASTLEVLREIIEALVRIDGALREAFAEQYSALKNIEDSIDQVANSIG